MSSLEIHDLCFGYEDGLILKDVNLVIEKGDYVGIIGSNGTGKSTLIKLMLGLLKADTGSIRIPSGKIGYVPQVGLSVKGDFPATVREVVLLNLNQVIGLFKKPKKIHYVMVDKALEQVGMKEYGSRLISKLSGGQQQRVMIAKALVSNPDVLILDEPVAGIDSENEKKFYQLLNQLNKEQHLTIIMVTHNIHNVSHDMNKIYEVKDKDVRLMAENDTYYRDKGEADYAVSV